MKLEEYYKAVDRLEAPASLKTEADIRTWYVQQLSNLRAKLDAEDLKKLNINLKHWEDKVKSSLL